MEDLHGRDDISVAEEMAVRDERWRPVDDDRWAQL